MKKVISFSLHGEKDKYCKGFYKNISLAKKFYPDWDVCLFYDDTVPEHWIKKYQKKNIKLINVDGCGLHPTAYRFIAFDLEGVDRVIFRDADSRLSERESQAVKEWEDSESAIHIMRDHPNHDNPEYPMFAGMCGMYLPKINLKTSMAQYMLRYAGPQDIRNIRHNWGIDQHFLRDCIYFLFINQQSILIHSTGRAFFKESSLVKDFPSPRNDKKNFVGEVFDFENNKEKRGAEWRVLV